MRINFSAGDECYEIILPITFGVHEVAMPLDAEILGCGMREKQLRLFYVTKYNSTPKKKKFLIHSTIEKLPRNDFQYYFYVGTVASRGINVFEIV